MQRKNPTRRLDKRLWFSLVLFAGLIILHQFLIQPALTLLTTDAPAINLAGRQRMLSQKLAKAALTLTGAEEPESRDASRAELASTLQTWRNAHSRLRERESFTRTAGFANTAIQRGFHELEPRFQSIADSADLMLSSPDPATKRIALSSILKNEPEFLTKMHEIVGLFEDESRIHVRQLQFLGIAIMVAILGAQFVIQFGVMRPVLRTAGREWAKIEADYELLVESMTDGLVVFDSHGRVEFANHRFCVMLGHNTNELVGLPGSNFVSDRDQTQFDDLLTDSREIAGPVDLQLRCLNGSPVDAMISPRRMNDVQGNVQGLLLVVTDVTNLKATEQRSRELQTQLTHADRLKSMGAMAAALAHEINQPLGAISNYAEGCLTRLTVSSATTDELVVPLKGILRAAHRGAEIVRRTRDFARRRPHRIESVSINELIHEVAELCRPEARRRSVSFELNLTETLPEIPGDGIQIQQVLTNLIQNAFNALEKMDHLRRWIKLSTRATVSDELEVSVADSGPGLPQIGTGSLFEPFVTTDENGTGLGLAIARGIVESHGGRIWNECGEDGRGVVFKFTLSMTAPARLQGEFALFGAESNVN